MCYVYAIVRGMSKRCLGMECYCLDVSEVCHAFSVRELHRFEPPMQVTNFLLTQKDMSSGRNGGAFHDCSNSSVGAYTAPWVSCSRQTHRNNPKVGSRSALECTHCVSPCASTLQHGSTCPMLHASSMTTPMPSTVLGIPAAALGPGLARPALSRVTLKIVRLFSCLLVPLGA